MTARQKCSTCGGRLVWVTLSDGGRKLVCVAPCCPGHDDQGPKR